MISTKNFGKQDKMIPCPCCGVGQLSMGMLLILEDIKRYFNGAVVQLNSGCRCRAHHVSIYKKLGKTPPLTSDHLIDSNLEANGADVVVKGYTPAEVYDYLCTTPYANLLGLGLYKWGVHVGLRGHCARWRGYK